MRYQKLILEFKIRYLFLLIHHILDISEEQIKSDNRSEDVIKARTIVLVICRNNFKLNLEDIGKIINKKHSTVIHHLKKNGEYKKDMKYFTLMTFIKDRIESIIDKNELEIIENFQPIIK